MTNEEIMREFSALPLEARREAADFIAFLRARYEKKSVEAANENLGDETFVGMWKDREDLANAAAFVRDLRQNEWAK